ncbi:Non-structural maintenance of chromosomes element 3-like protein [Lasiodiplodia hormozganensis]|uniref:Non-structural maintenance of chromosomes element 3-like protein n=1 Tax=Lasiodiplodia hormozganensis TaxID=869390 RepID=A0AA40CTQ4_9PEZI|nr:Non-structural maintenance of chromosomes element 3-like protein [Lasiodiplodia hormozganensis]
MPLVRKRRAPAAEDASDEEHTPTQRRRESPVSDVEDDDPSTQGEQQLQQMAKKLVRMALACEYARIPIRRADISAKVLGSQGRQFKNVFAEANLKLNAVFGMEMTELPKTENHTIKGRQKAAERTERQNTTTTSWVLTNTLPEKYRGWDIIPPPKVPTFSEESAYIGLYTFVVACITLGGGRMPEAKLERYLKRTNADQTTPVGSTEKLLARMKKDGYIKLITDSSSGEEIREWVVAGRGKVEIGERGVAGMVQTVYHDSRTAELDRKIERSLQNARANEASKNIGQASSEDQTGTGRGRGRQRRQEPQDGEPQETDEE